MGVTRWRPRSLRKLAAIAAPKLTFVECRVFRSLGVGQCPELTQRWDRKRALNRHTARQGKLRVSLR